MKDLHCHILMGIDDGSSNLQESLNILSKAQEDGITDIVVTPHYIKNTTFAANNILKQQILNQLKEQMTINDIHINLYLGNEVYIDEEIITLIKNNEIATINNSRYILIELPMMNKILNLKAIIFELINNGYIPIIAHPERYKFVQNNPLILQELINMGVLFQGNYKSLFGSYGQHAKKTLKVLLENNLIHFLGSDTHKDSDDYKLKDLEKKLIKLVKDKKRVEELLENNFMKVINNEEIKI